MATLWYSDGSAVVADNLSEFTVRQMSKIGMTTSSDNTHAEAVSNYPELDPYLENATTENPIPLGICDILGVPVFYPDMTTVITPPTAEHPIEPPSTEPPDWNPPIDGWNPGDGKPPWAGGPGKPPGGGKPPWAGGPGGPPW